MAGQAAASYETRLPSTSGSSPPRSPARTVPSSTVAARPTPEAPKEAPKPNGTGAVELEHVRSAWTALLERMRERSLGSAAQLQSGEPLAIEGGTVVLAFANEFARGWADQRKHDIGRDLSDALRVEIKVKCVRQTPRETTPATEDPMLRAALETFRRPERILEVE